ncbi:metal-sulfur cluster assembly factor [Neobacillus sp. D3-1R]|uniref:metal-sulfur cluster assembly factor n=1 Tax=Neobacillus sp. D3-1R TaxID=3445778 RepID=UPI003FA0635A
MEIIDKVRNELKNVYDPELNINVVDLGLIYNIKQISDRIIEIDMTLTTPGCPLHDSISTGVKHCVEQMEEVVQAFVNIVWEPAWSPDKMTEEGRRQLY